MVPMGGVIATSPEISLGYLVWLIAFSFQDELQLPRN